MTLVVAFGFCPKILGPVNVGFARKRIQLKWWRQSKVMGTYNLKNKLFALSDCRNAKTLRASPRARAKEPLVKLSLSNRSIYFNHATYHESVCEVTKSMEYCELTKRCSHLPLWTDLTIDL